MGASLGEEEKENLKKEYRNWSQPQHLVKVNRFAVAKYLVILMQYEIFINETARKSNGCYVWKSTDWHNDLTKDWQNPVTFVNWEDASAYVKWLSQKTGKNYRLLNEAEWEYVACAGTTTSRYWGDDPNKSCTYANAADQTSKAQISGASNWPATLCTDNYAYTSPVGSFKPNQFGLY